MKLYHSKLTPIAYAATTAQAGYPANNLGSDSVSLPWRATGVVENTVTLTLGAVATMQLLALHDVNFATCTVEKSVDGAAWVNVGALNTYSDRGGRRRGSIVIAAAGQLAVRFRIAAGVTTDGLGYWRAGAAHLFTFEASVGVVPEYGYRVRTKRPRVVTALRNGRTPTASTGASIDRIELRFGRRRATELLDYVIQLPTTGTCFLNLELPDYPEQQWPVRLLEEDIEETFDAKKLSTTNVPFTEVA